MRAAKWIFSLGIAALPCLPAFGADGPGLTANPELLNGPGWQGRMSLSVQVPLLRTDFGTVAASGLQVKSISLMKDYYLTGPLIGNGLEGGMHTTGGLIVSPGSRSVGTGGSGLTMLERHSAGRGAGMLNGDMPADASATVPYVGIGYVGESVRGRWSFSADVGLMSLAAGNVVKFGGVFNGSQSFDGVTRELRLAPVMQMGLSYSF